MNVRALHDVTETVKDEIRRFAAGKPISLHDVQSLAIYVSSTVINRFGLLGCMNIEAFSQLVLNQVNKENLTLGTKR